MQFLYVKFIHNTLDFNISHLSPITLFIANEIACRVVRLCRFFLDLHICRAEPPDSKEDKWKGQSTTKGESEGSQLGFRELVAFVVKNQSTLIWHYIVLSITVITCSVFNTSIRYRWKYHTCSRSNKHIFRKFCFSWSFLSITNVQKKLRIEEYSVKYTAVLAVNLNSGSTRDELSQ